MARKPFRGSTIDNIQQWGVGALNRDQSRIPFQDAKDHKSSLGFNPKYAGIVRDGGPLFQGQDAADRKKDIPQAGNRTASFSFGDKPTHSGGDGSPQFEANPLGRFPSNVLGEIPDYQKYFYCPKVTRRERHCGFEDTAIPDPLAHYQQGDVKNHPLWDASIGTNIQRLKHKILEHEKSLGQAHTVTGAVGNNHPTVKPVALMRYLIQLVTPANSHIVDPFTGSGTTGMAAVELGHRFTGIEQDANYVSIANKRIAGWISKEPATDKKHTAKQQTATENTEPFDRWFEQD